MYNRITAMNQWGDILYIGQYKDGKYRGWGDYTLNEQAIDEVLTRLYYLEEIIEDSEDILKKIGEK